MEGNLDPVKRERVMQLTRQSKAEQRKVYKGNWE